MPNPSPNEGDSSSKAKNTSAINTKTLQKIPSDSQSKVSGVGSVEQLINQIIDFDFDPSISEALVSPLQELTKIFINKSRDIKAGVRDSFVEKVISPLIQLFQERETTHLASIFDLKSHHVDASERQYKAKIRESESTI
ncbi:hypothetical protein AVEN_267240-1 [Araneus ventricosus]|uniref:Uncharacterized protein n=1 Tax=Araneus ventricosus TaxID=182803 RepID=A0A4Y2MRC8_ARAVE|nr:hypothetical protein AVEN_267240-1 [Araneus ventricosus]